MAGYFNRTISLVTGIGASGIEKTGAMSFDYNLNELMDEQRAMKNDDISPLQVFNKAKKTINEIYNEIEEYVVETSRFLNALQEIVEKSECELLERYINKVAAIREVLARNHMKVAFFGRTSNGKSSVINAMLREKILPSGIGHTTNCFCQVEGCDGQEAYLIKEDSEEKLNVVNIKQLVNALCQEKLNESSLLRIFWPRERCGLLRDDVIFVDSPGVDVSTNVDDWIDNHCLNADVFVLVLNAESTMTRAEKQFFHTVSQKLSNPNIFILYNRWDASASETEFQESVKAQHIERSVEFLTKELKVNNEKEALQRIFFISAREALQARLEEAMGNPPHKGALAEGFGLRMLEFQHFERKFEECISRSALKTKFGQHSTRGKDLTVHMCTMLDNIHERAAIFRNLKVDEKAQLTERIKDTENQMEQIKCDLRLKIHNMAEEVERRVSKALRDEIWRLGALVDEFKMPFHPDPLVIHTYKRELNSHLESGLGSNLRSRLSMALAMNIEATQRDMMERVSALVPNEKISVQMNIATRTQPFEMLYALNCQNLCAEFREDLQFKFSWGITSMIQRFTGKVGEKMKTPTILNEGSVGDISLNTHETPIYITPHPVGDITKDQLSVLSRCAISSIGSQGTVGGLIAAGILLKVIGWRLLFGIGTLYGCIYLYERISWTTSAKERAFKSQYVRHATKKLKMIVDLTSQNCSHQVQQELTNTFAHLCCLVEKNTVDLNEELRSFDAQLTALESKQEKLKILREKGKNIRNKLDIFENNYILQSYSL